MPRLQLHQGFSWPSTRSRDDDDYACSAAKVEGKAAVKPALLDNVVRLGPLL